VKISRFDPKVLAALSQAPSVAKQVRRTAAQVRTAARKPGRAPRRTGAGAKSIQVKRVYDRASKRVGFRVSWDRDHYYMRFHESGAQLPNGGRIRARHFLREAADEVQGRQR
jgi:hypothetical protein